MKKFSAIFSTLAVALLAIVMMGCPVAYTVGSPYSASPATTLDSTGDDYDIDYDALIRTYTGDNTVEGIKVTIGATAVTGADWNFSIISTITGAGLAANTNFASTNRAQANYDGWWGIGLDGYLQVGGTLSFTSGDISTPASSVWTIVDGTPISISYGGGLEYDFTTIVDVTGQDTALAITLNYTGTQNSNEDGMVVINSVRIDF